MMDNPTEFTVYCPALDDGMPYTFPVCEHAFSAEHIAEANLDLDGTVLIKSPMGTGKTHIIAVRTEQLERELSRPIRVAVIAHRVALIENIVGRVGFTSYQGLPANELQRLDKVVITPNSLYKLIRSRRLPKFDLIVIDEIEQVLAHLVGDTLKGFRAIQTSNIMRNMIQRADHVLAMDAYAGDIAKSYLRRSKKPVRFYENTFQLAKRPLYLVASRDEAVAKLKEIVQTASRPVFVASDQRDEVKLLHMAFSTWMDESRLQQIHGGNSQNPPQQSFLKDINAALPDVDMLIVSPTLSSGVDIQVEVEAVFGFFHGRTLGAEDLMQMLGRCREANVFYVYLQSPKASRETDWTVIRKSYLDRVHEHDAVDFDARGKMSLRKDHREYLRLHCAVAAKRNASLNRIRTDFLHLASQRYTIEELDGHIADPGRRQIGEELARFRKRLSEEERALILTSDPVDEDCYRQSQGTRTDAIEAGYRRWQIESFYGQTIDEDLLERWQNGKGKLPLIRFVDLYRTVEEAKALDTQEYGQEIPLPDRLQHAAVQRALRALLHPIFGDDFHCERILQKDLDVRLNGPFATAVARYQQALSLLGHEPRLSQEPLHILQFVIRCLGMEFSQRRVGKDKTRKAYCLNLHTYAAMRDLAHHYIEAHRLGVELHASPLVQR